MLPMKPIYSLSSAFLFTTLLTLSTANSSQLNAAETYDVGATRHKVASVEEEIKRRGLGPKTLDHEVDVYEYDVKVRSKSPLNPATVKVQYIIYVEQVKGRITPSVHGTDTLTVPLGKTISMRTNAFHLQSIEADRKKRKDVERETELEGFAIRVLHPEKNTVLGEKYSSNQIKQQVDWSVISAKKAGVNQPRPRRIPPGKKR